MTSAEALQRLVEGNRRFASGLRSIEPGDDAALRRELAASGQEPFAVVLGCSDSRVPAEILFDQGLGDLFVIRVAGNIVAPSQMGSVEFAALHFGSPLVVVLGHSKCGAIQAAFEEISQPADTLSPSLNLIIDRIRPSVEAVLAEGQDSEPDELVEKAVRANTMAAVNQLRHDSSILEKLIQQNRLEIVGAEYCLESGVVEFLDGAPGFD